MIKLLTVIFSTITVLLSFVFTTVVKVDVCHATGSINNPYVLITVAIHSVDDATGLNGHGDHPDDAWMSFVFENVTYPGQNEGLFGTIIDGSCNLIVPPTFTPIPPTSTDVPPTFTPTFTSVPPTSTDVPPTFAPTFTSTPTNVPPTSTPTNTPTSTSTATDAVPTPTRVVTETPTNTPTVTWTPPTNTPTRTIVPPTNTPTFTYTPTSTNVPPTLTPTIPPTLVPTLTPTSPTNTPFPPKAAYASDNVVYTGQYLGDMVIDGLIFDLYQGVNASDGSLMLPSFNKGAALYQNVVWVHRLWRVGWLSIEVGDIITINDVSYKVTETKYIEYGVYPEDSAGIQYIATCYSVEGKWVGVQLYKVELIRNNYR